MTYLLSPVWWFISVAVTLIYALLVVLIAPWLPQPLKKRWLNFLPKSWGTALVYSNLGRLRVHCVETPGPAPIIFMSNHQSLADIPVLLAALPNGLRFFSKKEVFKVPLMGWAMRVLGFISVDRENREKAIASLGVAAQTISSEGISVWLAPEGTRSVTGQLGPLKKGPFYLANLAKVPIIPVWVEGTHKTLPKHSFLVTSRVIVDVLIGAPIRDHIEKNMSHDELEENFRKTLLDLQRRCLEIRQQTHPPQTSWIGVKQFKL